VNDMKGIDKSYPATTVPPENFPINTGGKFAFVLNIKGKNKVYLWLEERCKDTCPVIHYTTNFGGSGSVWYPIMIDSDFAKLKSQISKSLSEVIERE